MTVLAVLAGSCSGDKTTAMVEKTCTELGDSVATANPGSSNPVYKVIRPNGGETFHVRDTMHVRIAVSSNPTPTVIRLAVNTSVGPKFPRISSSSGAFNGYTNCDLDFIIPDSVNTGSEWVHMVSDSVRVRAEMYNNESFSNDLSDDYFSIKP